MHIYTWKDTKFSCIYIDLVIIILIDIFTCPLKKYFVLAFPRPSWLCSGVDIYNRGQLCDIITLNDNEPDSKLITHYYPVIVNLLLIYLLSIINHLYEENRFVSNSICNIRLQLDIVTYIIILVFHREKNKILLSLNHSLDPSIP